MFRKSISTGKTGRVFQIVSGLFFCLFLTACAITDHTDDALEKARKFALKKALDLTEYQRNEIRYTLPKVLEEELFAFTPIKLTEYDHVPRNESSKKHKTKHLDHVAVSFVWEIPSLGGEVIVFGTGDRAMRFWEPVRVMYRKKAIPDTPYENARKLAADFTINNLLYLTDSERNRIRFGEAKVYCTSFDLAFLQQNKVPEAEDSLTSYLRAKKEKRERFQLSLVWQADDPDKVIVFTGLGAEIPLQQEAYQTGKESEIALLASWKVLSVHVLEKKKFAQYIVDLTGKGSKKSVPEVKK